VLAEPAHSNTTITNGRVSGFADGIVHTPDFAGTDYPTLTVNRVTLVAAPIRVEGDRTAHHLQRPARLPSMPGVPT